MSESKHTPGPWMVPHFAEPDTNCECGYVLCNSLMGAVATVHCSGDGDDWKAHGDNPKFAEACANARLIAAAPDMLAALNRLSELSDQIWVEMSDGEARLLNEAWKDAEAAIAKAEGRA